MKTKCRNFSKPLILGSGTFKTNNFNDTIHTTLYENSQGEKVKRQTNSGSRDYDASLGEYESCLIEQIFNANYFFLPNFPL